MDDLISRQAAIDALGERPLVWNEGEDEYALGQRNQYDSDKLAIETVPSAERHGRWLSSNPTAPMFGFHYCSICGRTRTSPQDHYCPNCGARMDLDYNATQHTECVENALGALDEVTE